MTKCGTCEEKFIAINKDWRYCSKACYYASLKVPLEEVYRRDEGVCHLCNEHVEFKEASRDHVNPRANGGRTTFANIKLAHKKCNSHRGHKPVEDFKVMWLTKTRFQQWNERVEEAINANRS